LCLLAHSSLGNEWRIFFQKTHSILRNFSCMLYNKKKDEGWVFIGMFYELELLQDHEFLGSSWHSFPPSSSSFGSYFALLWCSCPVWKSLFSFSVKPVVAQISKYLSSAYLAQESVEFKRYINQSWDLKKVNLTSEENV
jgi:hypothetical protein